MRRTFPSLAFVAALVTGLGAASLAACGSNQEERGLTPPGGESATPESKKEMEMTDAERQKQVQEDIQQQGEKDGNPAH